MRDNTYVYFQPQLDFGHNTYELKVKNCPNCKILNADSNGAELDSCQVHLNRRPGIYQDFIFVRETPKAEWDITAP